MRFLLLLVLLLIPTNVAAHGQWAWIQNFNTPNGMSCCDERDATVIPHEVANSATVGSQVVAHFPEGPEFVTIKIIHPTKDPKGKAWVTKYGCLFRWSGG